MKNLHFSATNHWPVDGHISSEAWVPVCRLFGMNLDNTVCLSNILAAAIHMRGLLPDDTYDLNSFFDAAYMLVSDLEVTDKHIVGLE